MTFKELKKGYPVFIITDGDHLKYTLGKVTSDATLPRVNPQYPQMLVVDVAIDSDGSTKIWTFLAEATSANVDKTTITTDKASILSVLSSIESENLSYLEAVPIKELKLKECKDLIAELDVDYREKQQTNKRLDSLELSISDIKEILTKWTLEK